jgi:hypothetical protein
LRQALSLLAWECLNGPISTSTAARVTSSFGAAILDRMEIGGFIGVADGKVDFQEDVLIDALVALDICGQASDGQSIEPGLEKLGKLAGRGINVALFVIQWLDIHHAHKPLWDLILDYSLLDYLEAVATRADASAHVPGTSDWFLEELLEGVDCIFKAHMPALRAEFFSLEDGSKPAIIGAADTASLRYGFQQVSAESATVIVTPEIPEFSKLWKVTRPQYHVNLGLSGVRFDGPRLIAARAIRDHLKKQIERDRLINDELWVKERLLGFLAWHFRGRTVSALLDATPDSLRHEIVALQERGARELHDGTRTKDVIADLDRAIAGAWGVVGGWDPDHASLMSIPDGSDSDASAAYVAREYRKTVQLYKNAVLASLHHLKDQLIHYPIFPLQYRLYLLSEEFAHRQRQLVVFDGWAPVKDWSDMQVECIWAKSIDDVPSRTDDDEVEQITAAVRGLGRPTRRLSFGGSHTFSTRRGTVTWAMENARSMLLEDIDHLFASVRTPDFYPATVPVIGVSGQHVVPFISMTIHDD